MISQDGHETHCAASESSPAPLIYVSSVPACNVLMGYESIKRTVHQSSKGQQ